MCGQNEWDKYFPIEENSGDLNIPDFNINDFNYGMNQGVDSSTIGATVGGFPIPSAQDLADVSFGPTYIPDQFAQQEQQRQQQRFY
jgi:hypothetical protein